MGKRALRAVLIGRGNVATRLGAALRGAGHEVTCVGGRRRTAPVPVDADLYILAVSDDSVPAAAAALPGGVTGVVVHTSGSVPMDALPQRRRGVLYPLQTLSRDRDISFSRVPLFVESDSDLPLLEEVARGLSPMVSVMDSDSRRALHLAAVFCSNFTNRLYAIAEETLRARGIGFGVMAPLIEETFRKALDMGPRAAQTGPAVRWDEGTMRRHLALIGDPGTRRLYEMVSKSIHDDKLRLDQDKGARV